MGLFLVKEIRSKAGELHFRRWRLFDSPWFGIYLHYIAKADEDKHPHDHPWPFVGIILWGGYVEMIWTVIDTLTDTIRNDKQLWENWVKNDLSKSFRFSYNDPGKIIFRRAKNQYHMISRIKKPTWTLVFHGPKRETWGYMTEAGWMDHQTYREEKRKGRWNNPQNEPNN